MLPWIVRAISGAMVPTYAAVWRGPHWIGRYSSSETHGGWRCSNSRSAGARLIDASVGRQTRDSTLVFAVLLAANGQRDRAREVIERHLPPGVEGADPRADVVGRFIALLEPTWLRCGLTGRLQEALDWCLAILSGGQEEQIGTELGIATAARCLTMLGRDGAARRACAGFGGRGVGVADSLALMLCRAGHAARARRMLAQSGIDAVATHASESGVMTCIVEGRYNDARALAVNLGPGERAKLELGILDRLEERWSPSEPFGAVAHAELDRCRAGLMRLIEQQAASSEVRLGLIRIDWLLRRAEVAFDAIATWYATDRRAGDGYARLGAIQVRAGRYEEAIELIERDRSSHRLRSGSFLVLLARCQAALGRLREANATLDQVHDCFPNTRGAAGEAVRAATDLWNRARPSGADAPRWDALEAFCRSEIERRRDSSATHLSLARCRALQGDAEGAASIVASRYMQDHHEADLRWDLGRVLPSSASSAGFDHMARLDLAEGRLGERRVRQWVETLVRSGKTGEALEVVALAARMERDPAELRGALHAVDPYVDFDHRLWPEDLQGWHSKSPLFEELIHEVRPALIVEVGTWKGGSAVHMAECCRKLGLPTVILCVDTWLGAVEFWMNREDTSRYVALGMKHGYPTVYYQFLANCRYRSHDERIVPFPQSSTNAARWLLFEGFSADLIYVDASHVREDVAADILAYWKILRPGGIMFGDDHAMPDVAEAVSDFARNQGLTPSVAHEQWILRKPLGIEGRPDL